MIKQNVFDKLSCGAEVISYTISNDAGASIVILNYGGIIQQINVPDKNGDIMDVICGFDTIEGYKTGGGYQGALLGRYCNRIKAGKFTLNGVDYTLAKNDGGLNHLHGGDIGFDSKIWGVEVVQPDTLIMTLTSPDGEEGYPGALDIKVTYKFDCDSALTIRYEATTDKDTVLNMSNHAYFNLNGYGGGDVLSDLLFIDSDEITEIDEDLIPTGKILPVDGTKFDFRNFKAIEHPFDNNFVVKPDGTIKYIAELRSPKTGIAMEVYTNKPAVQLYNGVMMKSPVNFKNSVPQTPLHAVCLETQYYPDSPNHDNFPSCVLTPDDKYDFTTVYKFKIF
jgi:Galactose mutarotase and related enzymes